MGFVIIGPIIGAVVGGFFYEGDIMDMAGQLANPVGNPEIKPVLMIVQGFATGIGLILIPWIYYGLLANRKWNYLLPNADRILQGIILSFLIVAAFMVVNSLFIEWNSNASLPSFLKGMEEWMREKESLAEEVTKFLTTFHSVQEFLLAILVIAILPAIGEEFVFRGLLQTELAAAFRNHHVAIWVSAAIFSAIHIQFFGFVPRLLLGALFGYLFYWSGNLAFPIIAHFIQNGGQLFILYMVQKGVWEIDMDSTESFPWYMILIFGVATLILLNFFRKLFITNGQVDKNILDSDTL